MFKLQNKFKKIIICLLPFLGLFLINSYQVIAMENNQSLKTIYNIKNTNDRINQNKPIKISYYVNDKNLSLEDMAQKINIINKMIYK
jgi:hypothetical protein